MDGHGCCGEQRWAAGAGSVWRRKPAGRLCWASPVRSAARRRSWGQFSRCQLYFDQLNAQGGIGRRQELRTLDDGYEPERCVAKPRNFWPTM